LIPTNLLVGGMRTMSYGKEPVAGPLFYVFVLYINLLIVICVVLFKRHYQKSHAYDERVRDQYLIAGMTAMIFSITIDFLLALGIRIYPVGAIGGILLCLAAAAALLRHNLLDMKVVLRKGIALSLAVLIIFGILGIFIYLLSNAFQDFMKPVSITITIIMVFIAALLFQPVLSRLKYTVDRWFFRERFDYIQDMKKFVYETRNDLDLEQLSHSLVEKVFNGMQCQGVSLLLPVQASGDYVTYNYAGLKNRGKMYFPADSQFVAAMMRQDGVVDYHDEASFGDLPSRDREILENSGIELMVALRHNGQMAGMLLLGEKNTRAPYSGEERQLLQNVSAEVAVSLDNANHVEIIKQKQAYLQRAMNGVVHAVSILVGSRDPYTAGHQRRVAELAREIAKQMGLSDWQIMGLYIAGLLHDVGKVSVPSDILSKPGKITEGEFELIKNHCRIGYDILQRIDFPWPVTKAVLQHHERLDGSGYPDGLSGKEIILEARILGVADVVEAMSSHRPYRPALGLEQALEEIRRGSGTLYDPDIVDICLNLLNQNEAVFDRIMAAADTRHDLEFEVIK
jgi:putative nucleotidyltransferase with HDIG domain